MNRLPSALVARPVRGRGRIVLFLVATVVLSTFGGAAFGYWSTSGSGAGSARTGTLNAPTGVTASSTAGSGSVSVGWSATTGTPGAQGYYIKRTPSGGGASAFACGTSASSLKTTGSCTDSGVADGSYIYAVTAVYNSWTATSAASASVTVSNSIGTNTTLASSSNPSVVGQQVTYTATVKPASGSTSPSGSVTFMDGSNSITCTGGNQTLAAGSATCSVPYTAAGTHLITAVYAGAAGFSASTSGTVNQSVGKAATSTTLTAAPNPSATGQAVTYTATVSVTNPGSGQPTGSVTFQEGATPISCASGNQALGSSGTATCQMTYTAGGSHSITATYGGDTNFSASSSPSISETVSKQITTTTLSSKNPQKTGSPVAYTATVSPTSGSGIPTGKVTFQEGSTAICTDVSLTSGAATCQATYGDIGTHTITATYSGDNTYAASTSGSYTQRVVNSAVKGLGFSATSIGGTSTPPSCGSVGPDYTCSLTATAKGAKFSFTPAFVDSTGAVTPYSSDLTSISYTDGTTPGTLPVPGGSGAASQALTWAQTGNASATYVFTFADGTSTFKVTLNLK